MPENIIYPIGVQSFEKLRRENCLYVDKTPYIWELVNQVYPVFLSRPRRFGKSLLMSTVEAYFLGKKDLFEGLAIYSLEQKWRQYPVFHFDFNSAGSQSATQLKKVIDRYLTLYENIWGITPKPDDLEENRFANLIYKASRDSGLGCVLLFDEYDKPLLNTFEDLTLQQSYQDVLKPFYGIIKTMDAHIRFTMITGVARFGKVSIFSDLNNLEDISLNPRFNAICGVSESELSKYFAQSISEYSHTKGIPESLTRELLRRNYDGYHFCNPADAEGIYNPLSLLKAFYNGDIADYWFDTGTPTHLVKHLIDSNFHFNEMDEIYLTRSELLNANVLAANDDVTLFQSGYLTIREYDPTDELYRLGFPNEEVERAFDSLSLETYGAASSSPFDVAKFRKELATGKADKVMQRIQSLFCDFPNDQIRDLELHYHNVVYLLFKLLGYFCHTEKKTSHGRIDLLVETSRYIYLFEFKLDQTAEKAMRQIRDKQYDLPFRTDGRKVIRIGVNFSSRTKSVESWLID